jgi:23S rRNA pseudouridine1911/1915/1917 synthase
MDGKYHYVIKSEDTELPIKELLKRRMYISSRLIRKLKAEDRVLLNGKNIRLYEKGEEGGKIVVLFPAESSDFPPEDIPIDVIYEDKDILALNKQAGIVVHPTKGHPVNTIANGLMKHMNDLKESYKIRFINRLDLDTTGVVLVGKNSFCQDDFTRQAAQGNVDKIYIAVVEGIVESDKGTIDLPIGKPKEEEIKRAIMADGLPSITHYETLMRFSKGYSLLRLRLETGRTHQIRVHLSHIGHPVVSDSLYGRQDPDLIERQALHADELRFKHPITRVDLSIRAPMPKDIERLIEMIK